jgi:uncharacterized membrane protein YjjB (DUF3815 family)
VNNIVSLPVHTTKVITKKLRKAGTIFNSFTLPSLSQSSLSHWYLFNSTKFYCPAFISIFPGALVHIYFTFSVPFKTSENTDKYLLVFVTPLGKNAKKNKKNKK